MDVLTIEKVNDDPVESGSMTLELKPADMESKFTFYGTDSEASAIGEQLLWLASVFRIVKEQGTCSVYNLLYVAC